MPSGDLQAELERHHGAAFGWALLCCGWDRVSAEEALQASYLKVLDGSAVFAGRSSFRTWLFGVIRRTAGEQRRRRALARLLPLDRLDPARAASAEPDPEERVIRAEANSRLAAALDALPERPRAVLHLVFYEELSIAQAAEVLGISVGTARTHYDRGKRRLRELLGEGGTR